VLAHGGVLTLDREGVLSLLLGEALPIWILLDLVPIRIQHLQLLGLRSHVEGEVHEPVSRKVSGRNATL